MVANGIVTVVDSGLIGTGAIEVPGQLEFVLRNRASDNQLTFLPVTLIAGFPAFDQETRWEGMVAMVISGTEATG
jgi:hypothetical protein